MSVLGVSLAERSHVALCHVRKYVWHVTVSRRFLPRDSELQAKRADEAEALCLQRQQEQCYGHIKTHLHSRATQVFLSHEVH